MENTATVETRQLFEKNILSCDETIASIKKDIDEIEDKYRKLAEQEKVNLVKSLEYQTKVKKFWDETLSEFDSRFGNNEVQASDEQSEPESDWHPSLPEEEMEPGKPEEEEKVVDTIFPENNEESADEQPEETTDEPAGEAGSDEWPVEESSEELSEEPSEEEEGDEEDWPELPEEWK